MHLQIEQIERHLQENLLPVYLIFGDEQMLIDEASDLNWKKMRSICINDRQVWHVKDHFDWSQLERQERTLSLFYSRCSLEIRLPTGTPGREGSIALRAYATNPSPYTTLLIISGKINALSQRSKWFAALDKIGVIIPIKSIDSVNLPLWILHRMQQLGLHASQQVISLISELVEGNLFAAAQEIKKLELLSYDGVINEQLVLETVSDNSSFQVFNLVETVLSGDLSKIPKIIARMRSEGLVFMSIFPFLSWSLHRIIDISYQLRYGQGVDQIFKSQKPTIWQKDQKIIRKALIRHDAMQWQIFLQKITLVDQAARGSLKECPWVLLENLCMEVAGTNALVTNLK